MAPEESASRDVYVGSGHSPGSLPGFGPQQIRLGEVVVIAIRGQSQIVFHHRSRELRQR